MATGPMNLGVEVPGILNRSEALIMSATFTKEGVLFRYPENWKLEREENYEGWTVYLQSPGTAFVMISYREGATPAELAETALAALPDEYPDLGPSLILPTLEALE